MVSPSPPAVDTPYIRPGEDEHALKCQYAALVYADFGNRMMAGYQLFQGPENYGRAMQAINWLNDPVVQIELSRLQAEDKNEDDLDLKAAQKRLAHKAEKAGDLTDDVGKKVAAYLAAAKILGLTDKGSSASVHIGDNIQNNVLRVPMKPANAAEEASFAARFKSSQMKLVADARSNRPN